MSIEELLNCFLVYPCSKNSHQFFGVGCLACMCLSWLLWILLGDIGISYQLLLRHTHSFSYGLLTRKNFSSIIHRALRFLSLAKTSEIQPRSCFLRFERISSLTWNVLRYSILVEDHHSLLRSSRTPGRFAMIVCYKVSHVITSCKWLTEASCSYVAPTQSTNSELIRR